MYRKMCILCQQTSPKRWFGNRTMTSNCDVTISAHQIKMTTLCRWMNPLMKIICVRHWQQRNAQSKEFTSALKPRLQQLVEREGWSQPALLVISAFFSRCDVRTWFGVFWSWGLIQLLAEKKICLICVAARILTYFLVHLDLYRSKGLLTKPSFEIWCSCLLKSKYVGGDRDAVFCRCRSFRVLTFESEVIGLCCVVWEVAGLCLVLRLGKQMLPCCCR